MKRPVSLLLWAFLLALAACGPAAPVAPIEVPEGTHVQRFPAAELDAREAPRIEARESLVLDDSRSPEAYFSGRGTHPRVAGRPGGDVWVHDPGSSRIKVFGDDGAHIRSFGRRGQGPGEFDSSGFRSLGFLGDRFFAYNRPRRISLWELDGSYVGELRHAIERQWVGLEPLGDSLVAGQTATDSFPLEHQVVRLDRQGEDLVEALEYARLPNWARATSATDPSGVVYVAGLSREHEALQIVAFDADGRALWEVWTGLPGGWSDFFSLRVDGHGHLYVLPAREGARGETRPVDVYDREGNRLHAGLLDEMVLDLAWQDAAGDWIFGIDNETVFGNWRVVRRRLVEPF